MSDTKLRININGQALIKTGELFSNAVLLGANVFLIGTSLSNAVRFKRQERIQSNLQLGAEIASAVAEFTNGIGEIYLHPSGTRDVWEEFIYYIYLGPDNILRIQVVQACRIKDNQSGEWSMVENKIFDGTPTEVKKWILG